MARASQAQQAQRLNWARSLLQHHSFPQAVHALMRRCSLSRRQAYRYLRRAQALSQPVPVTAPKVAFTVKLPPPLVVRLRRYAARGGFTFSDVVSQALSALLDRGRRRG
jgi:predicted DNA-binding transcriptional regulator YafY